MYNTLTCDDQPDIVNALKIYLAPQSYRLFKAFDGLQADTSIYRCRGGYHPPLMRRIRNM